jgi:hypothetical protein
VAHVAPDVSFSKRAKRLISFRWNAHFISAARFVLDSRRGRREPRRKSVPEAAIRIRHFRGIRGYKSPAPSPITRTGNSFRRLLYFPRRTEEIFLCNRPEMSPLQHSQENSNALHVGVLQDCPLRGTATKNQALVARLLPQNTRLLGATSILPRRSARLLVQSGRMLRSLYETRRTIPVNRRTIPVNRRPILQSDRAIPTECTGNPAESSHHSGGLLVHSGRVVRESGRVARQSAGVVQRFSGNLRPFSQNIVAYPLKIRDLSRFGYFCPLSAHAPHLL